MKQLKIFASIEEFEAAKSSLEKPFVVFERETSKVIYSNLPEISEDELDTAEYVDLGLPSGLKWASCNIGADKPCESGLLFQFGRVDGYGYGYDKFSREDIPTTTSGKTYEAGSVLDPEDDAAYYATNGKAHMPTVADIDELLAGTTNKWCQCTVLDKYTHNGHIVYGRLFTSNTNGNKIFIPAAGYYNARNGSFSKERSDGDVWSSSVISDDAYGAYRLTFDSENCFRYTRNRSYGFSVRGVRA